MVSLPFCTRADGGTDATTFPFGAMVAKADRASVLGGIRKPRPATTRAGITTSDRQRPAPRVRCDLPDSILTSCFTHSNRRTAVERPSPCGGPADVIALSQ